MLLPRRVINYFLLKNRDLRFMSDIELNRDICVEKMSGYFETLPSRDSTTSSRLVTSRLFILDTSRLCSGHLETIGHFETSYILDPSRLCPGHFETFRKKKYFLMYYETKTVMVGAKKL